TRGAKIHGTRTGIRTGGNMRITIENSTIASEGTAICSAYNTEITGSHATLSGGVEAVRLQGKPNQFDLADSTIHGAEVFDAMACAGASTAGGVPAAPAPEVDPRKVFPNLPKGTT